MRRSRRALLRLAIGVPTALVWSACVSRDERPARIVVSETPLASPTPRPVAAPASTPTRAPTVAPIPYTPTPFASKLDPRQLTGFVMPIEGACLPSRDAVMPNAPRTYRNGVHEGIDFYHGDVCTPIRKDLPVRAMYAGAIVRADRRYREITPEQVTELAERTRRQGFSDEETLDIYRGRQVWVDHGSSVVARYAHLSGIADGIDVGVVVAAGRVLGFIGESGTPESVTDPGTEIHLHIEVRVGDRFLGAGLPAAEVRALYSRLFSTASSAAGAPAAPAATPAPTATPAPPAR
ncbi:MAG: M23 family metallopeptidase [Chloroflexi bacterium]|nr:M23 family metallopeptidase [Chloroflexota bacterium]